MPASLKPPPSCNVYTPAILADAIVKALGDFPEARWLEPCVGKGAFLSALAKSGVDAKRVTGTDLAGKSEPNDSLARVRRSTEFLTWGLKTRMRFDRIVANPPFISLSVVPKVILQAALRHRSLNGAAITKGSNCWHAFLCASLRLLNPNGAIAFVLPAAFEYANYAASLREQLPFHFADVRVHRCRTPIFDEVEDGSVVVIAKGFRSRSGTSRRIVHDDLPDLIRGIQQSGGRSCGRQHRVRSSRLQGTVPLKDVMSIAIGAVTGDAQYFLMDDRTRIENRLPVEAMQRVVSKSRHIYSDSITKYDWDLLRAEGERVWLFRPDGTTLRRKAVKQYLEKDVMNGGCRKDGYKIKNRDPWYLTPLPIRPHGFLTGMSQYGPAICFSRMNTLSATNTLYTVRFTNGVSREAQLSWAMMLLTRAVREQLINSSRDYPLGLSKLEPGDLQTIAIPLPSTTLVSVAAYRIAIDALHAGDLAKSQEIAETYIRCRRL